MAYRNIFIENPARLSLRDRQLIVETDKITHIPVEDIAALLIESRRVSVTAASLASLSENGAAVYFCDEKHMPCAVTMPFAQHSRGPAVLRIQTECSQPRKKRLWQSIVKAKIANQARCLEYSDKADAAGTIRPLAAKVRSGDTGNIEAAAALKYFPLLFGNAFSRSNEDVINASLDYGYAILRGCIARHLAVYGFQPALGLHHRSDLNRFNLADDLIEPFRPVVDLMVSGTEDFHGDEFSADCRKLLFGCLSMDIISGGQHHSVSYAVERVIKSLSRALTDGDAGLCLPELLPLKLHTYE